MNITYKQTSIKDIECIYQLCKKLIDDYENIENMDYEKVLIWVKKKIENDIHEYTTIYVDDMKAGYYHFIKNEDGEFEIDDLYIFSEFQNKGIGTTVIHKCFLEANAPVILYVFIKNQRAVALYKRLGFEIINTIKDSRYIMKYDKF
ncbi:MAG: GNAT family N-acetyltransferase [Traorella sp.]